MDVFSKKGSRKRCRGFTPLEKTAAFKRRPLPLETDGCIKLPSARTVREQSFLTGFTLIELMITCLLIAILVSIAIPAYRQATFRAHQQVAVNNLYSIYQAEKQYWFDVTLLTPNQYTANMADLTSYVDIQGKGDRYWFYFLASDGTTFTATAQYVTNDARHIDIDETGSLTLTNWPPP